ncbi:hypothetical protein IMG5_149900, partial [Ichthyophthirius multifiliis]
YILIFKKYKYFQQVKIKQMPIKEGKAKLWFKTKEEEKEYDDRMVANIEIKSQDYDDENFSPVFNRKTQEFFLQPSERLTNDVSKILRPIQNLSFEQVMDKYYLYKRNNTYYRDWPFEKFIGGFGISYLILRELPLRNFYARAFVMYVFAAKLLDHLGNPFPYSGYGNLVAQESDWHHWDVRCYDQVWKALYLTRIPTAQNTVPEAVKWYGRQPGHLISQDHHWMPHFFAQKTQKYREIQWDGTNNMPINRLADPKHKDSYMIQFR